MQGIWKEEIAGFNRKDTKRKKQTRHHTLKDKLAPLVHVKYKGDKDLSQVRETPIVIQRILYDNGKEVDFFLDDIAENGRYEIRERELHSFYYLPKLYIYGKLVPNYYRYYKDRSNKFAKRMGSRITRRKVKHWLEKGEDEKCSKELYYRGYEWF